MKSNAAYAKDYRNRQAELIGKEQQRKKWADYARSRRVLKPKEEYKPRGGHNKLSFDDVVAEFRKVHGDTYKYFEPYDGKHKKMKMECSTHGEFEQTPSNHLKGAGCWCCGLTRRAASKRLGNIEFIGRSLASHKIKYDYKNTVYTTQYDKVEIICPEHGSFWQVAGFHMKGSDCPKCAKTDSTGERELYEIILATDETTIRNDRTILGDRLELDVYSAKHSIAIEYCGIFWHNTLKMKDPKRHYEKYNRCENLGIRLLTIYDEEWIKRRHAVEALISRIIKPSPSIFARKCRVEKIGSDTAFTLHDAWHIQGKSIGGENYCLIHDEHPVAVMTFCKSLSDRGKKGWELSRFSSNQRVIGGASRLFSAFIKEHNPDEVVSYSDNRYFSGGMYEKLGFALDGLVSPDYRVVDQRGEKTFHKASFRRKLIPLRLREAGIEDPFDPATDPRSERQVCEQYGFGRIYDCGKKRWLWKKQN